MDAHNQWTTMPLLTLHDEQVSAAMRERIDRFLGDAFPGCRCAAEAKQPLARVLVLCEGETTIAGHLALYWHDVRISGNAMGVGVIADVAISGKYRGQGLLNMLFPQAHSFFGTIPLEYSMVFPCRPDIFTDFGYTFTKNNLFTPGEAGAWRPFNFHSMHCSIGSQPWPSGDIYFSEEPCQT